MSSKASNKSRLFSLTIALCTVCVVGVGVRLTTREKTPSATFSSMTENTPQKEESSAAPSTAAEPQEPSSAAPTLEKSSEIILVNSEHPLPENYDPELTLLSNGVYVASELYNDLQDMFDDMRSQGIYPTVGEGFRTHDQQQAILDNRTAEYQNSGYAYEDALNEAKKWVAVPGRSEHELGLALDINADPELTANETVYRWLANYAHCYGFILRYPDGKTEITGIDYEPWHYRWVGKENAQKIHDSGLCLEEYLETIS